MNEPPEGGVALEVVGWSIFGTPLGLLLPLSQNSL